MIELDGVEYDKYLQVPDYYTSVGAIGGETQGLYGTVFIRRIATPVRTITLTAKLSGSNIYGQFKRYQVELLQELSQSGRVVDFNYHGRLHRVIVPMGSLDNLQMVRDRTDPDEEYPFIGTVQLIVMS